jgi:hypothetical protein
MRSRTTQNQPIREHSSPRDSYLLPAGHRRINQSESTPHLDDSYLPPTVLLEDLHPGGVVHGGGWMGPEQGGKPAYQAVCLTLFLKLFSKEKIKQR